MDAYDRLVYCCVSFRADLLCRGLCSRKGFRKQKEVAALSANCSGYFL